MRKCPGIYDIMRYVRGVYDMLVCRGAEKPIVSTKGVEEVESKNTLDRKSRGFLCNRLHQLQRTRETAGLAVSSVRWS